MEDSRAAPAPGDGRFFVLARLGEGGNGVVYRVLDMSLGAEVALKRLTRSGGRDLYRFKREFRALSDIVHPNLVRLYELLVEGDEWCLSMELIDGVPLDAYVRGGAAPRPGRDADATDGPSTTTEVTSPGGAHAVDLARLRASFAQLADAVRAIHASGKIHRDLKPSNVLVEPGGRVVVLDYGLVSDAAASDLTHDMAAVGTPAYMSPEQASDLPLTGATDWYAVGAMLYKALTGVRPFEGPAAEILHRRVTSDPPPPRALAPDTPPELDALCVALLRRDPARRAGAAEVLAALGGVPSAATLAIEQAAATHAFVGRTRELAALDAALALAHGGQSVVVPVTGPSGIGKTTLLRQFVASLDPATTLVFQGRCYERETMPYQAIDSLVDAVAARLLAEPSRTVEHLLPKDIAALARLFPTLDRVRAVAGARRFSSLPPDPAELRRRAVAAFGELLANLAGQRTPVFFLDDLQWSDPDSGAIVTELVHHFEDGGALFVVASRTASEVALGEALAVERGQSTVRLGGATGPGRPAVLVRELALEPMSRTDATRLYEAMAARRGRPPTIPPDLEGAGGIPLFVAELARGDDAPTDAPTLERLIGARIAQLPRDSRTLLELAAIAPRPLRLDVAAALVGGDAAAALSVLRAERLALVDRHDRAYLIEPVHSRIRDIVLDALAPEDAARLHGRLAAALEARPDALATDLVTHWLAAGEPGRAAVHARSAGEAAEKNLAFHRAAELYRLALADPALDAAGRRALLARAAGCLVSVGRLDAALAALGDATALLDADAPAAERRELRRREIECALRLGDYGRGLDEARALLAELGYKIPSSAAATIAAIVWHQLRGRSAAFEFTPVTAAQVAAIDLERIDTLWSLTAGLAYVNPGVGRLTQLHHLRAALDAGEPGRVIRALCTEIPTMAQPGHAVRATVAAAARRCRELIDAHGSPHLGFWEAACGVAEAIMGHWPEATAHTRAAEQLLRDRAGEMRWALAMAEFYRVTAAWFAGDTAEVTRLVPRYVAEAEDQGDAHVLGGMRTGRGSVYWLIVDAPRDGRVMAAAGLPRRNPDDAFHLHDYFHALADAQLDLYEGEPGHAAERVEAMWGPFAHSLVRRVQFVRLDAALLRARCAIAVAASGHDRKRQLAVARQTCDQVTREIAPWTQAPVALIRAAIAHLDGDAEETVAQLGRAVALATEHGMRLHARAARHRLGLCQGDAGAAAAVLDELRAGAVANPTALLGVLAPGW